MNSMDYDFDKAIAAEARARALQYAMQIHEAKGYTTVEAVINTATYLEHYLTDGASVPVVCSTDAIKYFRTASD